MRSVTNDIFIKIQYDCLLIHHGNFDTQPVYTNCVEGNTVYLCSCSINYTTILSAQCLADFCCSATGKRIHIPTGTIDQKEGISSNNKLIEVQFLV